MPGSRCMTRFAFQVAKSHLMALIKSQIQPSMAMAMAMAVK
jgi:hypothetical protein